MNLNRKLGKNREDVTGFGGLQFLVITGPDATSRLSRHSK